MRSLAILYERLDQRELSDNVFKEAFNTAVVQGTSNQELLVQFQANVGRVYLRNRDYRNAAFHFGRALSRFRTFQIKNLTLELNLRLAYSNSLWSIESPGYLLRAIAQHSYCMRLIKEIYGVKSSELRKSIDIHSSMLTMTAHEYVQCSNSLSALPLFERALSLFENADCPDMDSAELSVLYYRDVLNDLGMEDQAEDVEARLSLLCARALVNVVDMTSS